MKGVVSGHLPRPLGGPFTGRWILAAVAGLEFAGCATPKPILYPNAHLQAVGPEVVERDIADCRRRAEEAGATQTAAGGQVAGTAVLGGAVGAAAGAVGGAIVGAAASGAVAGGVAGVLGGVLNAVFSRPGPSPAYVAVVDRCLRERGYEPSGWQ
ncbi:MAG TPA: hypothetical protein VLD61_11100 [Methylomirabilota bacterium]|nr:hypothetical protein [Methylomirabilota bacterium]